MEKMTIRAVRKAKDISQQNMADMLGVHVNTYINWENNPSKIPIGKVVEFCSYTDVNIDSLIFLPESTTEV